jgi:dUTPase
MLRRGFGPGQHKGVCLERFYMKIGFGKLNEQARVPKMQGGGLPLTTPSPLELQAGERVDLKTGLVVRVPEGYILSVQSTPSLLVHKGLEVLGPIFVAPGDEDELKIPLYNVGKSQLNLQPGDMVATGILLSTLSVETEEFNLEKKKATRQPTRKAGKGDPFKFEVT